MVRFRGLQSATRDACKSFTCKTAVVTDCVIGGGFWRRLLLVFDRMPQENIDGLNRQDGEASREDGRMLRPSKLFSGKDKPRYHQLEELIVHGVEVAEDLTSETPSLGTSTYALLVDGLSGGLPITRTVKPKTEPFPSMGGNYS